MEVACGEYGDMVPSLVVALRSDLAKKESKPTNCDPAKLCVKLDADGNKMSEMEGATVDGGVAGEDEERQALNADSDDLKHQVRNTPIMSGIIL